ncbi:hypothetical protein P6P90_12675 [Ectobacillus antri]|jgi:hypothetical protein|uniref:Uncharacterized protein n=1 Tax=Ectobacillus antri TaxID=2486280 RepID=A0ABT6H636_9BACI|nr:hypothetical protein [Ectobacillus antri]MDG4657793.1 hypothetical protein [Ectobacillus antri]MDG5754816.1 hypothetical protein [Ectobacillus antri]
MQYLEMEAEIEALRRKAQNKGEAVQYKRESYDHVRGYHMKAYQLEDVPKDLDYISVAELLQNEFLPGVAPYEFLKVEKNERQLGWFVTVGKSVTINIVDCPLSAAKT